MRSIIILMITFMALSSESIELPSTVERLFDKAFKDNSGIAKDALRGIKKRNNELFDEIEKKISSRKSLRDAKGIYNTLLNNGVTRDQIISNDDADEDVRIVAMIYDRLSEEAVKGLSDYLPTVDEGDFMGINNDNVGYLGKWSVVNANNDTVVWAINEDNTIDIGDFDNAKWVVDGDSFVVMFRSGHTVTFSYGSLTGEYSRGGLYKITRLPNE